MVPTDEGDVEVIRDFHREAETHIIRVKLMRVPESEKFPEGVKYRLHYGTPDGDTLLRYDNSHGVHERHSAPDPNDPDLIDFPGLEALYRRFMGEIDDL